MARNIKHMLGPKLSTILPIKREDLEVVSRVQYNQVTKLKIKHRTVSALRIMDSTCCENRTNFLSLILA